MLPQASMQIFLALLLLTLAPAAHAGEELFTVQLEYFEDSSRPGFDAKAFRGRDWDLKALLGSFEPRLQWARTVSRRPAAFQGSSLCLRILETSDGKASSPYVTNGFRIRVLKNLLSQLRMRQAEMRRAGATYQVIYPSNCGLKH